MAICANCGKEIADSARFCTNCGAPVQSMQAPAQAGSAAHQDSPSQNIYDSTENNMTGGTGAPESFGSALEFGTTSGSGSDIYGTTPDSGFGTFENTSGSGPDSFGTASDSGSAVLGTASGSGSFGTASGAGPDLYGTASDSGSAAYGTASGSGFSGTAQDPAGAGHGPAAAPYGTAPTAPGNGSAYAAGALAGFTEVPKPSFFEAVLTCFKKYATFSGRARRCEYWYFALFIVICQALTAAIGNAVFGAPQNGGNNMLTTVFNLAVLVPQISVFWRRMHDIGKKGTWFFISLIPVIGWILVLVWECTDSQPGENEYGMSPKYPTA